MIKRNATYRFKPINLDVDMHVIRILWLETGGLKLEIAWVNRFYPYINHPDRVFLKREDVHKWEQIHV